MSDKPVVNRLKAASVDHCQFYTRAFLKGLTAGEPCEHIQRIVPAMLRVMDWDLLELRKSDSVTDRNADTSAVSDG